MGNNLPRATQLVWVGTRSQNTDLWVSQPEVLSSFSPGCPCLPRDPGPPAAGFPFPDPAEVSEDRLDSQSSAVNIGAGFSYLGVTSHSPHCQQLK